MFPSGAFGGIVVDATTAEEITVGHDRENEFIIVPGIVTEQINIHLNSSIDTGPSELIEVQSEVAGETEIQEGVLDLSQFGAALLIAYYVTKEMNYETNTDERIPQGCGAHCTDQQAYAQASGG